MEIYHNDNVVSGPKILGNSFFTLLTCQLKRPVPRMKESIACNISLLESAGKSLHPYKKICVKSSFEELVMPTGLIKVRVLSRRLLLWVSKEVQSSRKCSSLSTPSCDGHNAFVASLKLCLNL